MPKAIALLLTFSLLVLFPVEPASAQKSYAPYPSPGAGYVTDLANLLSPGSHERIEQWLWQVESRSGIEIIVVTVSSMRDYPGANDSNIEAFARGLFDAYGIGNMPKNDGVLLLVSMHERKARIELGAGYGHRRDADANRIMQDVIVPAFKAGDFDSGIVAGVEAIILEFASLRVGFPWRIVALGAAALILLLIGISLIRNGKRGWGYVFIGFAILLAMLAALIFVSIMKHKFDDSSGGMGSGGLGGFGGGFSGGGGATGSW